MHSESLTDDEDIFNENKKDTNNSNKKE